MDRWLNTRGCNWIDFPKRAGLDVFAKFEVSKEVISKVDGKEKRTEEKYIIGVNPFKEGFIKKAGFRKVENFGPSLKLTVSAHCFSISLQPVYCIGLIAFAERTVPTTTVIVLLSVRSSARTMIRIGC
jgi:hypothetical protein